MSVVRVPATAVIGIESLLHSFRIVTEYVTSEQTGAQMANVVAFHAYCVLSGAYLLIDLVDVDTRDAVSIIVCLMPVLGLVVQLVEARLFTYAVTFAALAAVWMECLDPSITTLFAMMAQMQGWQLRSNMLRVAALLAILVGSLSVTVSYRRFMAILAIELSSWATERYMLPWRIPEGTLCCPGLTRFILGFVLGVHVSGGSEGVRMRPCSRGMFMPESIRGFAIHGDVAIVRYRVAPLGVLFSYLDGLGVVPYRLQYAHNTISLYVMGVHVRDIPISDWPLSRDDDSFACATRFPFRRILLGVMLRASAINATLLFA